MPHIQDLKYLLSAEMKTILNEKGLNQYYELPKINDSEARKLLDKSRILSVYETGFCESYLFEYEDKIFYGSISKFLRFERE